MGFSAFFDTCTLFGEVTNDIILKLAEQHLYAPLWSQDVLDELERILAPRIGVDAITHRINAMTLTFPDAMVEGYEPFIGKMGCAEEDEHVLAAAYRSSATVLVTFNIKDFPEEAMQKAGIDLRTPDDFLLDVLDLYPDTVSMECYRAFKGYRQYPRTILDYCAVLEQSQLPGFATELFPMLQAIEEQANNR